MRRNSTEAHLHEPAPDKTATRVALANHSNATRPCPSRMCIPAENGNASSAEHAGGANICEPSVKLTYLENCELERLWL